MSTPDMVMIRTRTPLPSENMSLHSNDSHNTHSRIFQLNVEQLLIKFSDYDRHFEAAQVIFVIMRRYMSGLRKIYNYYSSLGYEESPDNMFVMNRMQMWRFLKDCRLHHLGATLADMDRVLAKSDGERKPEDIHSPYTKVLFREFLNHLISLACHVYHNDHSIRRFPDVYKKLKHTYMNRGGEGQTQASKEEAKLPKAEATESQDVEDMDSDRKHHHHHHHCHHHHHHHHRHHHRRRRRRRRHHHHSNKHGGKAGSTGESR